MDNEQENELIAGILRGQQGDFAILVDQYKKTIFNLAFWMTGNRQDADDLAQETFLKAYQKLYQFDRRRRFSPWLHAICLNLTRSHLRRQLLSGARFIGFEINNINKEEENLSSVDNINITEGKIIEKERQSNLQKVLMRMSIDDREVIVLRFFDERSLEDIAEIEGISLSAAKMRLYRCLEKMKNLLEALEKKGP